MLTEEQKLIHTEFRKYLRIEEAQKGNMLNTLINAAENNLPALIKQHIRPDFDCIYNDIYSIEELLTMSAMIKTDEDKRQRYYVVNVIYKQDNNVWRHLNISAIFAVLILKRHMANRQRISGSSSYKTISIL